MGYTYYTPGPGDPTKREISIHLSGQLEPKVVTATANELGAVVLSTGLRKEMETDLLRKQENRTEIAHSSAAHHLIGCLLAPGCS